MPPKIKNDTVVRELSRARLKRDCTLKSIESIHAVAVAAKSDCSQMSSLYARSMYLDTLSDEFRLQQDVIINSLIDLDRAEEFERDDQPIITFMESIFFEIKAIIGSGTRDNDPSASLPNTVTTQQSVHLPKIQLPKFDGSLLQWRSFRDIYLSLVHNNRNIGDAERFHYLLSCLSGSALCVIKSVPLSADNYTIAWGALSDRFDNKRLLASAHLDKLFEFKPITHESLSALIEFVNTFKENVSIIKSIGVNDLAGFLLFHMGSRVLDPTTLRLFESSLPQSTIPDFDELLNFVQQRCKILENLKPVNTIDRVEKSSARGKTIIPTKSVFTTVTSTLNKSYSRNCLFCDHGDHNIYRCPKFNELSVDKRRDAAVSKKLCFACLNPKHMVNACLSKGVCRSCDSKYHHSLLHLASITSPSSESNPDTQSTSINVNTTSFVGAARTKSTVVLGTAIIHIKDAWGQTHAVRALLDSGSQISAMTNDCFARLGLPKTHFESNIVGLAQSPVTQIHGATSCHFSSHFDSEYIFPTIELVILSQITATMPPARLPSSVRDRYEHLSLADKDFDVPSRIDVLLGADVFPSLIRPHGGIEHYVGFPSALDTKLGWIIFGSFSTYHSTPLVALTTTIDQSIGDQLQRFWSVEEPVAPEVPTTEDQWCEEYYLKSTSRDPSGRFCVALPFRDLFIVPNLSTSTSIHGLGDSRITAMKRFYNLEKRLNKDPGLYVAYRKFMSEYQTLGHMVPASEPGVYFIPHHAVLKTDGDLSKIRVVFDASAVSSSGLSLNDVLCTGPKLQTDLRDILLRCRTYKYIMTADIVKMYRQILIRSEDRKFQHIFWRDTPEDELQEFQLCTITYGINCAPYLAIRCLHELDVQDGDHFPLAKNILTQAAYVDDIVFGADTEEQLLQRKQDIIGLLRSGACELSKWTSNSTIALDSVHADNRITSVSFDPRDEHSVKVLGLHWDTVSDNFAYHTCVQGPSSTKRQVLSIIARLFDPIGALGPMLLWAKCFMQLLWCNKLDWDDPLPANLLSVWQQFCLELPAIFSLNIPRHIDVTGAQDVQLLGFADASIKGYAATVYLRIVDGTGAISVHFVTCKTKVAPMKISAVDKSLSIPRMELCGALLLARTLQHTYQVLSSGLFISRIRAWSDSSIVLSWLTSDQKYFKIFITNRVAKIHELLPNCGWNHVPTTDNPADPASRGLMPKSTISSILYWKGPHFLRLPEDQWPQSNFIPLNLDQLPETRPQEAAVLSVSIQSPTLELIQRFSSLTRMKRVLSYIFRFCDRLRRKPVCTGPLEFAEREKSFLVIVKCTQEHYFAGLIKELQSQSIVTPSSIAQLAPYVDQNNVVRVGGRLRFSSVSHDAKHPILLPRISHLTDLLIRHYHLSFLHGGPKLILSMLNRKFWILSGRSAVRRVIFSCVPCTRLKAVRPQPKMADLPTFRVQQNRPFSNVGMDYGGPFIVKEHRRRNAHTTKVYLALFVCMSVKAIHLEIVSDLTTGAFLAALDRFVARRGIPSNIYSDCGTNYVGAARQLRALFNDAKEQQRISSHLSCTWHFNPPAAPHFGGIWEAGIKSVKFHLKHVIGSQILSYEEFYTLTIRIEGILNSRPITPLSSDPHDLCALTPAHFLIGQPIQAIPEPDATDIQVNRLTRWQLIQQCHQSYWKRWSREYLSTLQQRHKWFKTSTNLAIGDMVIVEAPSRPPTEWRLGRITEVHPGSDNTVRIVSVRTQEGTYKRPVVKLVRLPIEP